MSDEEIQQSQRDFMAAVDDDGFGLIRALVAVFLVVCIVGIVLSMVNT